MHLLSGTCASNGGRRAFTLYQNPIIVTVESQRIAPYRTAFGIKNARRFPGQDILPIVGGINQPISHRTPVRPGDYDLSHRNHMSDWLTPLLSKLPTSRTAITSPRVDSRVRVILTGAAVEICSRAGMTMVPLVHPKAAPRSTQSLHWRCSSALPIKAINPRLRP